MPVLELCQHRHQVPVEPVAQVVELQQLITLVEAAVDFSPMVLPIRRWIIVADMHM